MTKNNFALECMKRLNEFGATQPSAASPARPANFDKNGNQLFYHEDCGTITSQEVIEWFNIMFHDPDNAADDCITGKMVETERLGRKFGFITDKTQKYW
jgi:hypothetical protein